MTSSWPLVAAQVRTDRVDATISVVGWHRNVSPRFFCNAPGRSPASVSTWKPLQIPSTAPPSAAKLATASITGEKRASAPGRK